MSGELRDALEGAWNRVDPADRRVRDTAERTNVIRRLTGADYISLAALFVGWASALLLLVGEPNWALVAMFGGFGLDKLDGWYARHTGTTSPFGRQVDSFIDVFVYLVTGALLYHYTLSPHLFASLLVGFLVLAFGGLRLVRHNSEGFGTDSGASFYHGTTVVHTNVLIVANYLLAATLGVWNGWVAGLTIVVASPLMVSDYKAYKTDVGHALVGVGVVITTMVALALEFGYI